MAKKKSAAPEHSRLRRARPEAMSVHEINQFLSSHLPPETAESWDPVGLLVGDPQWTTEGAVLCVDLTQEAIELAKEEGLRLIINHHPCIFPKNRGLSRLTPDHLAVRALQAGIAVIAAHTNFDRCALEVTQAVSSLLGAVPLGRLMDHEDQAPLLKLVTFVPQASAENVREALCRAGAGAIGHYTDCSFNTSGEGTFYGVPGSANPAVGEAGQLERVKEVRIETILPKGLQKQVLQALFESHPYEEVAFDLYPVVQAVSQVGLHPGLGYGFVGEFEEPISFAELTARVKEAFEVEHFWCTADGPETVKRIAFSAGKGSSFVASALANQCDWFITGEVGYHGVQDAAKKGLGVIELGHRESERFFTMVVSSWLSDLGLKTIELNRPIQRIL